MCRIRDIFLHILRSGWPEDCGDKHTHNQPHAVKQMGNNDYCYDANGNMTRRIEGSVTYEQTFNSENRLRSVVVGGSTTTFIYDADGNRIQTIEPVKTGEPHLSCSPEPL